MLSVNSLPKEIYCVLVSITCHIICITHPVWYVQYAWYFIQRVRVRGVRSESDRRWESNLRPHGHLGCVMVWALKPHSRENQCHSCSVADLSLCGMGLKSGIDLHAKKKSSNPAMCYWYSPGNGQRRNKDPVYSLYSPKASLCPPPNWVWEYQTAPERKAGEKRETGGKKSTGDKARSE